MKTKILIILLIFNSFSQADTILGVYVGAQTWLYNNSGDLSATNSNFNAFERIDQSSENSNSIFIAIEHAVPFLPNLKLRHTNFEINNFVILDTGCAAVFPNVCFPDTDINLSHTDFTLYYELLDNWVNLDLGFSAIYFNGHVDFDTGLNADLILSEFIPAFYSKAMFKFPITDLSASITANIGTITDNTIVDVEISAQYKIGLGFSVEAGIRQQTIDFKDFTELQVHSDATGIFAGINYHF